MKYITTADEHIKGADGKYYGYAWFITETGEWIVVAFKVGKKNTLVAEPVWKWIKRDRTAEQQRFIEDNIKELQKLFK